MYYRFPYLKFKQDLTIPFRTEQMNACQTTQQNSQRECTWGAHIPQNDSQGQEVPFLQKAANVLT